jgi:serine kinase of HPr protein (carbohydrate metabolism regulator)
MPASGSTIHASCVLVGAKAVLIRGDSGSGKSSLAFSLLEASRAGKLPPAWLVDDRVFLSSANGRLLARAPESISGKIEIRGLGIREVPREQMAVVSLVVDLGTQDAARMPEQDSTEVELLGVKLSRLPIASHDKAFPALIAALTPATKA